MVGGFEQKQTKGTKRGILSLLPWFSSVDFRTRSTVGMRASVDGFDIERVSQHEGRARGLAGVGQPVPAEHAFAANGQIVLVRRDQFKEELEVVVFDVGVNQDFSLPVHEADVHLAGVQVDSAVEFGGGGIILHTQRQ